MILFKLYHVYRVTGQFIFITYKVIIIHHVDNVKSVRMCTKCAQYPHSAPCLAPPRIPNRLALVSDFGTTDIGNIYLTNLLVFLIYVCTALKITLFVSMFASGIPQSSMLVVGVHMSASSL